MEISTIRFGRVQISDDDVIRFPEGLLGFGQLGEFVLVDDPQDEIFAWLQSCQDPAIAFPVLEPELFVATYKFELARHDLEILKATDGEQLRCFVIITIPQDPRQMTANMKAPVVINPKAKLGRQCVLQDNSLAIKEPIFAKLQQRVVHTNQSPKRPDGLRLSVRVMQDKGEQVPSAGEPTPTI